MTASPVLLPLTVAPGDSPSPSGPAVVVSPEFGQALGAALASILSGVSPLGGVQPAAEPVLPSLDLTFEIETVEDGGAVMTAVEEEPLAPPAGSGDGSPGPQPVVAEPLSLERGLDLWLGRLVANAGGRPARQPDAAGTVPNETPAPSRPRPVETGFGVEVQLAAEPGVLPEPSPVPGPAASPIEPAAREPVRREPRLQPEPFEERPQALDVDQGVSVAVLLGRRAALESIIEIAGFAFPAVPTASRPESASRPVTNPLVPAPESQSAPLQDLPHRAPASNIVPALHRGLVRCSRLNRSSTSEPRRRRPRHRG